MQTTDISTITDLNLLKAMAFDQLQLRDQAVQNLSVISARIDQVKQGALTGPAPDTENTLSDASADVPTEDADAADTTTDPEA